MSSVLLAAACATVASEYGPALYKAGSDQAPPGAATSGDRPDSSATPPPFEPPPEPSAGRWTMPDMQQRHPTFPLLPGESLEASRSVGNVTHGWLFNARRIPQPHPYLKPLAVQYQRGLNYTSGPMLELLDEAAAHVADQFPGSVVYLGNFSAPGGGDIPYSASHNSGRDGDVGFFVVGPDGEPVEPPDLLALDEKGRYEGDEGIFVFDAPRNWALIEGLIEAGRDRLQYIFVSNPLRDMLLREARRQEASRTVISRAKVLLHQPGGSLPHNDHFHLRMYCSEVDVRSGCRDFGRKLTGYDSHRRARRDTIRQATDALGADDPAVRLAAVRRLGLLEAHAVADEIAGCLGDTNPRVRTAAARTLGQLGSGGGELADHLADEDNPQVVVELISALGELDSQAGLDALIAELETPRPVSLPGRIDADARTFAAGALANTEDPKPVAALIAMLDSPEGPVRVAAAGALGILTNHRLATRAELVSDDATDEVVDRWQKWFEVHGDQHRREWLACGFRDAGYGVERLTIAYVWKICRAVADADYLSYNAQRVLMGLSGRHPASLRWSKKDANFYWRRWFERRRRRFGAPPIPHELSTLE